MDQTQVINLRGLLRGHNTNSTRKITPPVHFFFVDDPNMKTSKRYSCPDVAFIGRK